MKINKIILLFLLSCLFLPLKGAVVEQPDTVPFEIGADKRVYVRTYINGDKQKPFRFLVDTGASGVVLNAALPEVMAMAQFTSQVVNRGATSSETIPATKPGQKIQIGHNEVTGLTFIAIPYPPQAWDGVLGLAFLQSFDVVFNYDRKEIYLYRQGTAPKAKGQALPFEYRANVPIVPVTVTINGVAHPLKVEVDSGSDRVLDLNTPYVRQHQLYGTLPVFAVSSISGTSATQGRLENVCFDSATIAGISLPLLPGAFSTLTTGLQATEEFDGVMGNNLLQRFNQQWDFVHKTLYLTPNHRFYTPFYDFLIAQ